MRHLAALLFVAEPAVPVATQAQLASAVASDRPFVIEYYDKIKDTPMNS